MQFWIREFTAKKRKQNDAARKKIKILKGPTVKQQRKEYERYLKNMAGWKLVDLKPYTDKEVFDLYQQAKKRTDTFYPMGCAEDLEQIAQMNKKLVIEKVAETEHVQEVDIVKQIDGDTTKIISSVQGDKRKGAYQKSIAKKKRRIGEGSSSMPEGDKFQHDFDHIPSEHLKEQLKVLTVVGKMEVPEVLDAKPIGIKYPIVKVTTGYDTNIGAFHDVERSDGKTTRFLKIQQMLEYFDKGDFDDLWTLYKAKFGATKFDGQKYEIEKEDYIKTLQDNVLWRALKLMYEPSIEDFEWTEIVDYKVKQWKLFQESGIHMLTIGPRILYMLGDKEYPVMRYWNVVNQMINGPKPLKLQKDYDSDDQAFKLLTQYKAVFDHLNAKEVKCLEASSK